MLKIKDFIVAFIDAVMVIPTVICISILSACKWIWDWLTAVHIEEEYSLAEYVFLHVVYNIESMPKTLINIIGIVFWIDTAIIYFVNIL